MTQDQQSKIDDLREALADYASGDSPGLFDYEAEAAKASVRKRALGLLDQRARSRHELQQRLIDAEFEPRVIEDVLDDLVNVGLINDQSFAREWVRQRHARRGKSARALNQELIAKGVSESMRIAALEQVTEEDEESTARGLAMKKARSVKEIPADRAERDKVLRRIVGVLARRGFNGGLSLQIARSALDDRIAELE